jgi:adenosine deaminase
VSIDLQNHRARGISMDTIMKGMRIGTSRCPDIETSLIICLVGEKSEDEAIEVIKEAYSYKDLIAGIGLATSEVGLPIVKFQKAFTLAKELGFKTTAHFWDNSACK